MAFFDPQNNTQTARHRRLYALYEIAFTTVDVSAAVLFVVGSALFFYPELETPAIWCFLIGSICFAMKPTIRIVRELHYLSLGDFDDVDKAAHG
ncbi:YrhK family protein [Afifella sp. H1R]|uniref:YrhK family protein n=1 Tax=Afifella sp. H1R TaxID=2908841 RepID=UPI001F38DFEE|nr:YrhK family protein [Afifella sp. H1R]MCF1505776.1 YrhK family protein [Afifella sp. H1R]